MDEPRHGDQPGGQSVERAALLLVMRPYVWDEWPQFFRGRLGVLYELTRRGDLPAPDAAAVELEPAARADLQRPSRYGNFTPRHGESRTGLCWERAAEENSQAWDQRLTSHVVGLRCASIRTRRRHDPHGRRKSTRLDLILHSSPWKDIQHYGLLHPALQPHPRRALRVRAIDSRRCPGGERFASPLRRIGIVGCSASPRLG